MKSITIIFLLLTSFVVRAQDSTDFTYNQFMEIVFRHHPMAIQANLRPEMGEAYLRKARGGFDPKLFGEVRQKYFEETNYYSYLHAGLKVPTWFGLSLQGGFDNNRGYYLGNESTTPVDGLIYAGITANLGNGLLMDARRAELKQSKIYLESNALEQRLMLNQLRLDASIAYFEWQKAYFKLQVYNDAVENAQIRFEGVKRSAELGDRPYIDTLEAYIQVQNRLVKQTQSEVDLANKKAMLDIFLWQDGLLPLEIDSTLKPEEMNDLQEITLPIFDIDSVAMNHPDIQMAENKIDIAKIDFRLHREALKPTVELKYNALTATTDVNNDFAENYSINNYNWGAKLAYPIFTRKERGQLKLTKLQIQDQEAGLASKSATVRYKITSALNTIEATQKQAIEYEQIVRNYQQLYAAEMKLFNLGESSIFMINSRDKSTIDAQVNYIELITTYQIAKSTLDYQRVAPF